VVWEEEDDDFDDLGLNVTIPSGDPLNKSLFFNFYN
jgi:hypothetical protein